MLSQRSKQRKLNKFSTPDERYGDAIRKLVYIQKLRNKIEELQECQKNQKILKNTIRQNHIFLKLCEFIQSFVDWIKKIKDIMHNFFSGNYGKLEYFDTKTNQSSCVEYILKHLLSYKLPLNKKSKYKMSTLKEKGTSNKLDFYVRARKEYESSSQPFTYELNLYSTQPKPKKFMIIINRFIDVFKEGMKWEYADDEQMKDNYWTELEKYYGSTQYEMIYIQDNSYEKKKNKLRLYFGLLIHNKKLFQILHQIHVKLSYMWENPQQKTQSLDELLQPLSFLKNGHYNIMSEFVSQYEKFQQEKIKQDKIKQKLAEIERKKAQQLEKQKLLEIEKQKQKEKQQQERIEKQKKEEEIQRERLRVEQQLKLKQIRQQQKKQNVSKDILDDSIGFIPETYRTQYAHDKTNQLMKRRQQIKQSVEPDWSKNLNKKHQKNSEILFEQKYKDEFQVFSFRLKPETQGSKQKCAQCGKQLKQGWYLIGGNQNRCEYTGEYFCNQHMAQQRIAIPWRAIQSFDLRGYPVSRKAYIEIKSYYQKPIIQIKNESPLVKQSKMLYQFLVIKRQIHLMYDSICDLELMQPLLKKKLNYCLRQNLFSLKNLYDIYNGHQTPSLVKEYDILSKHFYRCQRCQKRKGYICPKCKDPVKIFAFELKETQGCSHCRKLYHRKCLIGGKCECQDEE